jgi:predicted RNA-binding Zn ribbon-like protein
MADVSRKEGARGVMRCASESLCLDFVNTLAWRKTAAPEERLVSPLGMIDWSRRAGLVGAREAAQLRQRWTTHVEEAHAVYAQAAELRDAIYRTFTQGAPADALRVVNHVLAATPPRACLALADGMIGWKVKASRPVGVDLLTPIAWSAADLLAGPRAQRVRQCEDERGCGWLFLDQSRAGTRRWCSMGDCGNRAKARRHYLRQKQHQIV